MVFKYKTYMDINLISTGEGTLLNPSTIHGMLWLQTHFPLEHWDSLASKQVIINDHDANNLYEDASEAGLTVKFNKLSCTAEKFWQNSY